MELAFVRSVNISAEKAPEVLSVSQETGTWLTCHGQYFINLNAKDSSVLAASKKRIQDALTRCNEMGVWSICYHAAYRMGAEDSVVYSKVLSAFKDLTKWMKDNSINVWLRPETSGKLSQFGTVDEMIRLSQDVEGVLPCIDWAHQYTQTLGACNTLEKYREILVKLEKGLGRRVLDNMHCHIEGVVYGPKGERYHVNLKDDESKFNWKPLLSLWKEFKIKGVITCESPNQEDDAMMLKKMYYK
jgi:deoxyribonuclease IV